MTPLQLASIILKDLEIEYEYIPRMKHSKFLDLSI